MALAGHRRTAAMLLSYYVMSIALTLYNKWMISVFGFKFPLTIVMAQMVICFVCMHLCAARCWLPSGEQLPALLGPLARPGVLALGLLNALDVGCSVAAFVFVDVAFFEVVKSTCPVWLLLSTFSIGLEQPSLLLVAVVLLNCLGVACSSFGQAVFSWTGFCLAGTAGVACGVKMALMQTVLQDAKRGLSPTGTFYLMAPIMFVALAPLQLTLEVPRLRLYYSGATAASAQATLPHAVARAVANATARQAPGPGPDECIPVVGHAPTEGGSGPLATPAPPSALALSVVMFGTALLALGCVTLALLHLFFFCEENCQNGWCRLNIAEMNLVEATSALTLNIANTAKFAAIILLSITLFCTELSSLRVVGILLCVSGVGLFNLHKSRMAKEKATSAAASEEELELRPLLNAEDEDEEGAEADAGGGEGGSDVEPG